MNAIVEGDALGPEKIIHIRKPRMGLEAIVVVDNVAAGPSIGGVRMAPDVTLEECARLARAMTLKNAMADLPHGGGKSVIKADPRMPAEQKQMMIRAFAREIAGIDQYIPGPDMGTNETAMAWVLDEIGRCVGLPRVLGGIPLDEIGATGHGLAAAIEAAEQAGHIKINGARVAVEGFGAVGKHAAIKLIGKGAKLVAVADSAGSVFDQNGLDCSALLEIKKSGGKVGDLDSKSITRDKPEAVITADCDILIPAARPDSINNSNAADIKAKLIAEGANIPASAEAEQILFDRGVFVIPDFVANAGGVICASVEYHGGNQTHAMAVIAETISRNVTEVLELAAADATSLRKAASKIARKRVEAAMLLRRFG